MLTKQQKKLLLFIKDFQEKNGISPSYDEMRCALNQKSKSSVHMLLSSLVERGFIRKLNHKARAIEIIKFIQPSSLFLSVHEPLLHKEKEGRLGGSGMDDNNEGFFYVPFYGSQSTVFPLRTFLSPPEKTLMVEKTLIQYINGNDYCCLQISGDSLKEMAILDGDILFFNMSLEPAVGSIVLALVDQENIHVKKWEMKNGKVELSLGNKYMMPQVYEPERVVIKGVMAGLKRKNF